MSKLFSKKVLTVYLPESGLLNSVRDIPKYQQNNHLIHLEKAQTNLDYFKNNKFWEKDAGYEFVRKALLPLIKNGASLLDVGCSVGPLPEYLKISGLWDRVKYYGIDINECAINLAGETYPEGSFKVKDVQDNVDLNEYDVDIVYEKGMLISSYYPYRVLEKILSLKAEYVCLIHCPLLTKVIETETGYYSALNISEKSMYIISIMDEGKLMNIIESHGYIVERYKKRKEKIQLVNGGDYRLYDFLIRKKG